MDKDSTLSLNDASLVIPSDLQHIIAYSAIPEALFKDPSALDDLLEAMPQEVSVRKENNTVYMENKSIRMHASNDKFGLTFLSVYPHLGMKVTFTKNETPARCDEIYLLGLFDFPPDGRDGIGSSSSQVSFYRPPYNSTTTCFEGKEEWFVKGEDLLKKAGRKYAQYLFPTEY